jgi:hypothetical protein
MKKILARIGHRGAFLLLTGFAFIFYGLGLKYSPPVFDLDLFLTLNQWVWVWIITGIISIAGSFDGIKFDKMSFGFATVICSWWAIKLLWVGIYHNSTARYPALLWIIISGILVIVASWPENPSRPKRPKKDRE